MPASGPSGSTSLGRIGWERLGVKLTVATEIHRLATIEEHLVVRTAGADDAAEEFGVADLLALDRLYGRRDTRAVERGRN